MALGRRRGTSLATRVTIFTLIALLLAVFLIGVVSLLGVYDLARREDTSRLLTYRLLLVDGVDARLSLVEQAGEIVAASAGLDGPDTAAASSALERALMTNAGYFDTLAIADGSGRIIASAPADTPTSQIASSGVLAAQPERGVVFVHERGTVAGSGRLWMARPIPSARGLILVARVQAGYLDAALEEVATDAAARAALLVDERGRPVASAVHSLRVDEGALRMTPAESGAGGEVFVDVSPEGPLAGYYAPVSTAPELGWSVAVLEPSRQTLLAARAALLPAGLAALVVCVIALLAVLVFGRRVAAPLAAFERRARDIASGGYVRPMLLQRTDELGRLADAFNAMGVRLNSLQDMAQLLASTSRADDLLDAVLSATGHLLGTADAAVLLTDEGARHLVLARGRGIREPDLVFALPVDEPSPVTTAFRERLAVTFQGQSARWAHSVFRLFDASPDRSGVAVPLVVGEHVLGVVVALAAGRHPLTEAHVETLRAFCAQAAVALHTSGLFQHERASRTEAEALREAAELVAGTSDLEETLGRVAAIAARLLDMRSGAVAVDDREEFGLPASDDPERESHVLELWRSSAASRSEGASSFDPILLPSAAPDVGAADDPVEGPVLLVPLIRGEAVRGVLMLTGASGGEPAGRVVATAGALGRQLSLALENAALLQEARTKAANLETVFRISQAVSSSLQVNVVLNRVLDVVQKIFSADAVALMSYDPGTRQVVTSMARGIANREMLYLQVAPGQDIPGAVFEARDPVSHPDLEPIDTPLARLALQQGLRSLVAVPLLARGRSIGVLVAYDSRPAAFSKEDVELLLTFASQAALAIDTAGLYSKEHHVASILQASILPQRLPDAPGLEADSFYLPAGAEAEIGGDYYDLFVTGDGTVVVAIGDVCGKGVLAATKTSMIKYTLRGMVSAGAGPAEALAELNRLVAATGDPSDILTAWVGYLDRDRRTLVYADGGHPPALLRRAGGRGFARLSATGPLLGAAESSTYKARQVEVGSGDLLVTYTDGVTEARSGRRFFGEGRIRRVMLHSSTAGEAVDGLLEAVSTFSAGVMRDDAAALALRVLDEKDGAGGDGGVTGAYQGVDSVRTQAREAERARMEPPTS